ncbi:uncharacterized protein [Amphiura filiformis]|uniref:uncharacterized protein n=1 Tax=Amphiura filiformis TaxID=82378 RepID=UPI003B21BAC7
MTTPAWGLLIQDDWNVTSAVCSQSCLRNTECRSYQYSYNEFRCLLFPYDSVTGPEFIVYHEYPGYVFYDSVPTRQTRQEHHIGECLNNLCENGASCMPDCSNRGYYCNCASGYRGDLCETGYFHEPLLVQEIYGPAVHGSKGFTYDNDHYLVVGAWQDVDDSGNSIVGKNVIYKYNKNSGDYEHFQYLYYGGETTHYNAFEIDNQMYIFQCNHRDIDDLQDTESKLYVYKDPLEAGNENKTCENLLGIEDGSIHDDRMTASTVGCWGAYEGRLNYQSGHGAWIAGANDYDQWIAVDLGYLQTVTGVVTQGRHGANQWVTSYTIEYSEDGVTWFPVNTTDGVIETFTGNSDWSSPVYNYFNQTQFAQHIKIRPTAWYGHICMRFDVIGCDADTPFEVHQTFATRGAYATTFVRDNYGHPYFFISNMQTDTDNYDTTSEVFKWYTRYSQFYTIQEIDTKGATRSAMFDIDDVLYVAIPFFKGQSSGFSVPSELWKRGESYEYMGCYLDEEDRAMTGDNYTSSDLTIDSCIAWCRQLGHPFAGMQSASYCICGDSDYDVYGVRSDGECNSACTGDSSEACGAAWRNSVYRTEPSWEKVQNLPGTDSGGGANSIDYFEHGGSHYIVITRFHDESSCDHAILICIWNAGNGEFDAHQTLTVTGCFVESTVFKVQDDTFLIAANNRQFYDVTSEDEYAAENTIYKLEGTKFVKFESSLTGRATWDWDVFWRDEELYLVQGNERNHNNTVEGEALLKIYHWE